MSLAEAVAALLTLGPAHGYELMSILESELGPTWEVRPSNLYLVLGRTERDGLVLHELVEQFGRPDRRLLKLTSKGAQLANQWLDEAGDPEEFLLKIAVTRLVRPGQVAELAARMARPQTAALAQLRSLRAESSGGLQREAVNLEIGLIQARLRWLSEIQQSATELASRPRGSRSARRRQEARTIA